jgi:hypothetical protein
MKKSTATDVNKYQKLNSIIYMIDSDQRPDSNRRPLLNSAPHWRHYFKSRSDLRVLSYRRPFQILRSMADLLVRVRVRVRAYVSDVIYIFNGEQAWQTRVLIQCRYGLSSVRLFNLMVILFIFLIILNIWIYYTITFCRFTFYFYRLWQNKWIGGKVRL